ncbi:NAD(P)/FAD-dependent oxidoreductase [Caldovatus aquaticus]|uniref:NAD(P)/FAD-dependent oxidoreductase n=1 Tax=Caldovatus aquaticus TaxID=2865671 RepID=A0ABS7F8F0_9PROT|nr:FAD/NAD(P)-binding oxidoreductase [Caldovatus aquaticus]MBW8271222.1 NAD(P)/FAD-dependent oxidoreductase [Caldovatus aquaticus]
MTDRIFRLSRRAALAGAAASAELLAAPATLAAQTRSVRLVIVGGATAARFARLNSRDASVPLIEPQRRFVTCPYGNLVLGGMRRMEAITHGYDKLRARWVNVVPDAVVGIDPARRAVRLRGGRTLTCDRLILSPGIALRWGAVEGYD